MMQLRHPRQAGQGHAPRLGDGDELAKPFAIDAVIRQDEALRRRIGQAAKRLAARGSAIADARRLVI
jgi:hypothetical protein